MHAHVCVHDMYLCCWCHKNPYSCSEEKIWFLIHIQLFLKAFHWPSGPTKTYLAHRGLCLYVTEFF